MNRDLTETQALPRLDADAHHERTHRVAVARANARAAVEETARAFPSWSATPPAERGVLLQRASELLRWHVSQRNCSNSLRPIASGGLRVAPCSQSANSVGSCTMMRPIILECDVPQYSAQNR